MIRSFEDLEVYEKSYQLGLSIYKATRSFPKEEMFVLTSQIRRAATSIPLNISEGYGKRDSVAEFKRYLNMSKGSCDEMRVLLRYSKDLGYVSDEIYQKLNEQYKEIGKMLFGLCNNWK